MNSTPDDQPPYDGVRWCGVKGVFGRRRRWLQWRRGVQVSLVFLLTLCLLLAMAIHIRPIITTFAESNAVWLATKIANETVAEILEQEAARCQSLIQVAYNEQKILSSVFTDTLAINTVKTAVTAAIIEKMEEIDTVSVGIPLGTLLGFDWLSGWGPPVPFSMSVTSSVLSSVSSTLEAVGMNQSNYRVLIDVSISLYVVTPGGRSSVAADFSYPMAEAVLLGEVPDNLTEVYGDDQTLLGKIFDYGTAE